MSAGDFFAAETPQFLTGNFPVLMDIFAEPTRLADLVQDLSSQRMCYPLFAETIGSAEPWEYSKREKCGLSLGGGEYISPFGHSFRRQLVYSQKHDQALELLIPGQPSAKDRLRITKERLSSYQYIAADNLLSTYFQPVLGFWEYPLSRQLEIYGEQALFDEQQPLGVIVYDYGLSFRGKRIGRDNMFYHLGNMSWSYLERVFSRRDLELFRSRMLADIGLIVQGMHEHRISNTQVTATGGYSGLHLGNFLLTLSGKVIYNMDSETWNIVGTSKEALLADRMPMGKLDFYLNQLFRALSEN